MDLNDGTRTVESNGNEAALALDTRMPIPVLLIWLCALAGLALYAASWYVPALAQIGQ